MEFPHGIRTTAWIPSSYHYAKEGLHTCRAFLPLFLEFRSAPERFLRAHLCGGQGRVEARPKKRFLLRTALSQKHGTAANESVARTGGIHGGELEGRHEIRALLVCQKTAVFAPGDDNALHALLH